jgi:hypothetical protein
MADKQAALVNALAEGTHAKISPEIAKLSEMIAKLTVTNAAMMARLEAVEGMLIGGADPAAKRTVKTAAAPAGKAAAPAGKATTVAKKAAAGAKKAGGTEISNVLLYFRHMMEMDLEDARATYGTPENLEAIANNATFLKQDESKDPAKYWSAAGAALWGAVLTEEDKKTVKTSFLAYKEGGARNENETPLDEE